MSVEEKKRKSKHPFPPGKGFVQHIISVDKLIVENGGKTVHKVS